LGCVAAEGSDCPKTFINGADIEVNLDFVVLEGDERKGKTWIAAEPELQRDVNGGFGEGVSGSANLARSTGVAGTIDVGERGIGDKSELGGVSDHLKVSTGLFGSHGKLIPDVHPVSVLAIDTLSTDFDLDLGNDLFAGVVEPSCVDGALVVDVVLVAAHLLVDFGESDLKVRSVAKIAVSADGAGNTASKVGLSIKSLFNGF